MDVTDATNFAAMADAVAERTSAACNAGRPLFFIIHYEHEAIKLSFLATLRKTLAAHGISTQTFDPSHRPEHGIGRLYPLMAQSAGPRAVAVVEGLPRHAETNALDTAFLEYFNLHRDLIVKEHLRLILLLHGADAESFIAGAGDLWDFRHHTFWLEGRPFAQTMAIWDTPDFAEELTRLPEAGRPEVANHLRQVRELVEKTAEVDAKGALLLDLSKWLFRRYLYALAADVAREGLNPPLPTDSPLRGKLEFQLAYALRNSHLPGDALTHYQNALAICREIGDRAGEGATLNNIASLYHAWGRYEEAQKTLQQSLAICREIGDRAGEGVTLNNISQIYHSWGRYEEALQTLQQSLAICREIGDRAGEGATLNNISQIYKAWGRYEEALKTLEQSLAIRREIGDRAGEGVTCWNLAHEFQRRGELDKAIVHARRTVAIDKETHHPDLEKDREFLEQLEGLRQRQNTDIPIGQNDVTTG